MRGKLRAVRFEKWNRLIGTAVAKSGRIVRLENKALLSLAVRQAAEGCSELSIGCANMDQIEYFH